MLCIIFNIVQDLLEIFWALKEKLVGRKPTRAEYKAGRENGLKTLISAWKEMDFQSLPELKRYMFV